MKTPSSTSEVRDAAPLHTGSFSTPSDKKCCAQTSKRHRAYLIVCRPVIMARTVISTGEAAPASGFLTVDYKFLKSPTGILFLVQIACSLLAVVLAGSWRGLFSAGHVLFVMADIAILLCSSAVFVARLVKLDDILSRNIIWPIIFACYSGPAALLAVVFSCVMVAAAKGSSVLKAAGVFGLFTWNALLICFLLHFKPLLDKRQQQQRRMSHDSSGVPRDEESEASDDWSDEEESQNRRTAEVALTMVTVRPPSVSIPVVTCAMETHSSRTTPAVYATTTQPHSGSTPS
ncbi:Marvel domain [Trinorchestia longiramus]|nr:Marvel domain [Trinorchestia longiramus]